MTEQLRYPADGLVYENWSVSANSKAFELACGHRSLGLGTRAAGTKVLLSCFTQQFFALMAELMTLNNVSHEATVDIFGANPRLAECGFFEAKRDDGIKTHQKMLFGFIAFLTRCMPGEVLRTRL